VSLSLLTPRHPRLTIPLRYLRSLFIMRVRSAQMRNPANLGRSSGRARDASQPDCGEVSTRPAKSRNKNALTHGIYGRDILLPWESREEFESLLTDLRNEFHPSGRMENDIVFDMAHLRWQKYRMHQMWIAAAHGDLFVSDLVKAGQNSWAGIC